MTSENTGVVNNRAEIADAYNEYGIADINSTPNNNMTGENDLGSADVIIGVSTGGTIIGYIMLIIINTALIAIAIKLMIKNNMKRKIIIFYQRILLMLIMNQKIIQNYNQV